MTWRPDPTFYPSPTLAAEAPPEELAYVALLSPDQSRPDAMAVVDVDPASTSYGQQVGQVDMPGVGDEVHHFGWNACSSHLCPWGSHAHIERRYLVVPGIHSSNVYILDTKPDPRNPQIVKTISSVELAEKTGYANPHTVHCGPDQIYLSALSAPDGKGPGGLFTLDHETFDVKGAWELDRGPQYLSYDFFWHLGHDTLIASEWGTAEMVIDGLNPEILLAGGYGHQLHVFGLKDRSHKQALDLGAEQQMVLELRPAHDPRKAYGFAGVVVSLEDLSASIWLWYLDGDNGGDWKVKKVITIPAEPADVDDLPDLLKGFGAVPPLVTDINLSVDDQRLYVSCWGTGEMQQYDVSNPHEPKLVGSVRIGGIVGRAAHPSSPGTPLNGGPQMVETSRDGSRVYFTNSLYSPWDAQFYPDGVDGWMVKLDVDPSGGIALDENFFTTFEDGLRSHQVRLQGGDASSDSFCFS